MGYSSNYSMIPILIIVTFCLLNPIAFSINDDTELHHICLPNNTAYTRDYGQSLAFVLIDLVRETASFDGFRNASYAWPLESRNEQANGMALCRGDVSPDDCTACVYNASYTLVNSTRHCPTSRSAMIWRDRCFVKYLDVDFFGTIDTANNFSWTSNITWKDSKSADGVEKFMIHLSQIAILQNSTIFYAQNTTDIEGDYKLYGVAQCTRDLSKDDCKGCFEIALKTDINYSNTGEIHGYASCFIRYDTRNFLSD